MTALPEEPATDAVAEASDRAADASSSTVGPRADDEVEPLPGTDPMTASTGGLAGTSR